MRTIADSTPTVEATTVRAWLTLLHGRSPGFLHVCSAGDWDGRSFPTAALDEAAAYAVSLDAAEGVYLRCTTLRVQPLRGRGGAEDSLAVPGLWADLDIAGPGHNGAGLLPDVEAARSVVAHLPAPTLSVHSGGGLHVWWLWREPHVIEGDLADVEALSTAWHASITRAALDQGWHVGGTGDLARVLRIPGTVNRKEGLARPCQVIEWGGPTYDLDELRAALPSRSPDETVAPPVMTGTPSNYGAPTTTPGPFDVFAEHASWADLFRPLDYTLVRTDREGRELWKRPGATSEHSVTAGELVAVSHSTETGLPSGPKQHNTKARVFAWFHHGGDESAAARDLLAAGRGEPCSEATRTLPAHVLAALGEAFPADGRSLGAPGDQAPLAVARRVTLTPASAITPRPVVWTWADRMPTGSLALLAGREGIGKSTVAYQLAADLTRGVLPGVHHAAPKGVIVAATEDSWEHTIVPRLMAAGADLMRVFRVDVITSDDVSSTLSLPRDLIQTERAIHDVDAVLLLLDPLMSRLSTSLDTHKDGDVRQALEPLTRVADRTGAAVLGLIHQNKGVSTDPLRAIMGSTAFAAVARAVLFVVRDPDDKNVRLLGQPKNNLGRDDLPTLTFTIETAVVAETIEGTVTTGRITWGSDSERTIDDILEDADATRETRTEVGEAGAWLVDYLKQQGGEAAATAVKAEGAKVGFSFDSLKRSRKRRGVESRAQGFPATRIWFLPDLVQREQLTPSSQAHTESAIPGGAALSALSAPSALTGTPEGAEGAVRAVSAAPRASALSGPDVGPCTRCRTPTLRYGDDGHALCAECRAAS